MKKIYTSPSSVMAKTRLIATILAGSNGGTRPDGTTYPENVEAVSGNGGPATSFDARKRLFGF